MHPGRHGHESVLDPSKVTLRRRGLHAVVGEGGNSASVEVKWGASHAQTYFQHYSIINNWGFVCLFV